MTTDYSALRARLSARLDEVADRANRIEHDLRQPGDRDSEERAAERENDEVLEGLDETSLAEIRQLQAAIERIDQGTYGLCSRCGKTIAAARLEALPAATTCVPCAASAD